MKNILFFTIFFPLLALGADIETVPGKDATALGSGIGGVKNIIITLSTWMYTILLVLAVIFILLAAFYYLTAAGNSDKINKAHKMLIWTIVAIIVAMLAWGITFVVKELVTGSSSPSPATENNGGSGWGAWWPGGGTGFDQ